MSSKSKKLELHKKTKNFNIFVLLLTIFSVAIIPLLVRITPIEYPMNQFSWYIDQTQFFDVFSMVKANAIVFSGIVAFMLLFYYHKFIGKEQKFFNLQNSLASVYGLIIILSTLFSISTYVSMHGFLERYESVFVLLSYLMIFMLSASLKWDDNMLKKLMNAFFISNVVLSVIGIFQYFGIDLVFNDAMKPFIASQALKGTTFDLSKSFDYTAIFQTLYHSNYVGLYTTLSFPIFMTLFLYERKKVWKGLYLVLSIMILFNSIGSISRGGIIGIALGIPLFIILNHKIIFKNKVTIIVILLIVSVTTVGFEFFTHGFMTSRFKQIFSNTKQAYALKGIVVKDDHISIDYKDVRFDIEITTHVGDVWRLKYTLNGETIDSSGINENGHAYFDGDLKNIEVFLYKNQNALELAVEIDKTPWTFAYDQGKLEYKNIYGKFTSLETPETLGFSGMEKLGSGRGYIWSRTLPKIMKRPILGYGPETFPLAFPQNDYVGKYIAYGTTNMLVDKPHNLYLQIAVSTGLLSLIVFIIMVGANFKNVFGIFRHCKNQLDFENDFTRIVLYGFTVSIFSYLVASSFCDSNVHVSVVFWVILGISFSLKNQVSAGRE
ncbi:O-antigen ligase family protein [Fusibacter ferrireducens]|uniref:O-antigen ligase family protein n=1 Tax=Fusibacter ferrireducens TaxID=2785058 RepID=A0ABR9ZXC0_9FIRM|nr:O-antigen ligase family protein [Fusibacter ferrireducens]MBF4695107.1 O-antigen ligase family protein [Fusibacter ferrireducens]